MQRILDTGQREESDVKSLLWIAIAMLLVTAFVVACGGGDEATQAPAPTATAEATATPEATAITRSHGHARGHAAK